MQQNPYQNPSLNPMKALYIFFIQPDEEQTYESLERYNLIKTFSTTSLLSPKPCSILNRKPKTQNPNLKHSSILNPKPKTHSKTLFYTKP